VHEGIPLVRGAARKAIAECFAQVASLAFAEQGTPILGGAPAPVEEHKPSSLFGRRR
jgi:hypothetical protein